MVANLLVNAISVLSYLIPELDEEGFERFYTEVAEYACIANISAEQALERCVGIISSFQGAYSWRACIAFLREAEANNGQVDIQKYISRYPAPAYQPTESA